MSYLRSLKKTELIGFLKQFLHIAPIAPDCVILTAKELIVKIYSVASCLFKACRLEIKTTKASCL